MTDKKLICIDYDGTYTVFPKILDKIIELFTVAGHEVICATMRTELEKTDLLIELESKVTKIYYTARAAKLVYLLTLGISPDLWIEDNPSWLFCDG